MALIFMVGVALVGVVAGEAEAEPKAARGAHGAIAFHITPKTHPALVYTPAYGHPSTYGPPTYASVTPAYGTVSPSYHAVTPSYSAVTPAYHAYPSPTYPSRYSPTYAPSYHHHADPHHAAYMCHDYDKAPSCSYNTTRPWCLYDREYPEYEIKEALHYHKASVLSLYADVADLSTGNSVYRPRYLEDETYLCPSETMYARPLRAINTDGHWRIIVNNIHVDYEAFTQTTRIEECLSYGACPLVPHCYESKCLQKSIYHRFLVYDPCDQYFPFSVETFKLPASCACLLGAYYIDH